MTDNIKLLNDLVLKIQDTCKQKYTEVEDYIKEIESKPTTVPGAHALKDPAFYLQVYSEASTAFTKCSNYRISFGKIIIDIKSLLTQLNKVKTNVTLTSSFINTLKTEKEKCEDYLKVLEIQQRSLDSQLRYYSSVQYVLSSPHWLQSIG